MVFTQKISEIPYKIWVPHILLGETKGADQAIYTEEGKSKKWQFISKYLHLYHFKAIKSKILGKCFVSFYIKITHLGIHLFCKSMMSSSGAFFKQQKP